MPSPLLNWTLGLALACATTTSSAATESSELPSEVLVQWMEDAFETAEDSEARSAVLRWLASHPRAAVRMDTAELAGMVLPAASQESLLRALANDPEPAVRTAAARGLALSLDGASGLDRIQVAAEWALTNEPREREAIAWVLAGPTEILAADWLIDHLLSDPHVAVRSLAAVAMRERFSGNPRGYRRLVLSRIDDKDRRVRRTARRLAAART